MRPPNVLLDKTSTQNIISPGTGIYCNICANVKAGECPVIGENETRTQLIRALTRQVSLYPSGAAAFTSVFVVVGNVLLNIKIDLSFNKLRYLGSTKYKQ